MEIWWVWTVKCYKIKRRRETTICVDLKKQKTQNTVCNKANYDRLWWLLEDLNILSVSWGESRQAALVVSCTSEDIHILNSWFMGWRRLCNAILINNECHLVFASIRVRIGGRLSQQRASHVQYDITLMSSQDLKSMPGNVWPRK